MDNQKTPSERISGMVKFYNRDNDYGFILADNKQLCLRSQNTLLYKVRSI